MNIGKINILNKTGFYGELPVKDTKINDNTQFKNSSEVFSDAAAQAITSINAPVRTSATFIRNVDLPYLNLRGNLYVLPNGQKCLIAKKEGPCILKTFFKVGSMNEPDKLRGISHFIEHNLFNGSKNLKSNEFVENVNKMGGRYNASTGYIGTDYFIQSPLHTEKDLEEFIKMHADMLSNPKFSEDMLAKEKGPVISEIQMLDDSPQNLAANTVLRNLFGIKSTSSDLIGGSVENIKNLTRDDVVNYYRQNYNPKTALTVVVGDVDEKKTLQMLSENFAQFKTPANFKQHYETLTPITKSINQLVYSPNAQATTIQIGFACPSDPKELAAINVLISALTGYGNAKLTKAMRDMNLTISSGIEKIGNAPNAPTEVTFSTTTSHNNEDEVLKTIYQKIHETTYMPISADDLQTAKNKIRNQANHMAESNMSIVSYIGANFINGNDIESMIDFEKNLNSITAQDVMNAARKFLDLNKASICVVRPQKQSNVSFCGIKKDYDIKTYQTPNNAKITTLNVPNAKLYSLSYNLKTTTPPKSIAIPALLTRIMTKGTSLMSEENFLDLKDKNNIESCVWITHRSGNIDLSFPKESLQTVLSVIQQNMYAPALTQENFEKAKKEIKNLYLSSPKSAADRADEEVFQNSPACSSLRKICEELDKVSLNDVINYYNQIIAYPECKISLSGNLEDPAILNTVYSSITQNGRIYNPNEVKIKSQVKDLQTTKVVTDTQERNQADIVQAFSFHETGNIKDRAAFLLLNEILGGNSNSRLFQDLREKQKLAYHVSSSYGAGSPETRGALVLKIGTTTENKNNPEQSKNLQKALNGFRNHLNKIIHEEVTEDELKAAKLQIKSQLAYNLESTEGKNSMLVSSMGTLYKTQYLPQLLAAIDNATAKDIKAIANYYLTKPSVISIVGSKKTISDNAEYLKTLGEVKNF